MYFYNAETGKTTELKSRRLDTVNTHGTGCTLSSAFAASLAKGMSLDEAARAAKDYIAAAIEAGADYDIGPRTWSGASFPRFVEGITG